MPARRRYDRQHDGRRRVGRLGLLAVAVAGVLAGGLVGCSSSGFHVVRSATALEIAPPELPEDELLDVGVAITSAPELGEKALEKQGTTEDIRAAERLYIPYHLKNTLQKSSYWGAIQVVPAEDDVEDLLITTELIASNGETMEIAVQAIDASGQVWLEREYRATVRAEEYDHAEQGEREAFQGMYNTIANDLAVFMRGLSPQEIHRIRAVSALKFARGFSPEAFGDYLVETEGNRVALDRLPADDDPMMARIAKIRQRDEMFVDTLNQYYDGFYSNMRDAYKDWRQYNLSERIALREVKRDAFVRTLTGALMVVAGAALEIGGVENVQAVSNVLVLTGGQVVISGVNVSKQAEIHAAAIEELGQSFGAEMRPTTLEVEGKQYELNGTAKEQYAQWQELLRRIYFEETGFDPDFERFSSVDAPPAETVIGR